MTFKHHPDHLIYINGACYPLDWWLLQEPAYSLPDGAIARLYDGDRHILYSATSQWAGDLPWSDGDRYLANAASYKAIWDAEQPQPPEIPAGEAKLKWKELDEAMANSDLFAVAYSSPNDRARDLLFYAFANSGADDDRRLADFQFAISQIRASLETDYTTEQLQRFRETLATNGFPSDWI